MPVHAPLSVLNPPLPDEPLLLKDSQVLRSTLVSSKHIQVMMMMMIIIIIIIILIIMQVKSLSLP